MKYCYSFVALSLKAISTMKDTFIHNCIGVGRKREHAIGTSLKKKFQPRKKFETKVSASKKMKL